MTKMEKTLIQIVSLQLLCGMHSNETKAFIADALKNRAYCALDRFVDFDIDNEISRVSLDVRDETLKILDMWRWIETRYRGLDNEKRREVAEENKYLKTWGVNDHSWRLFTGFSSVEEPEHYAVARMYVDHATLTGYEWFRGRRLSAYGTSETMPNYRAMWDKFRHMPSDSDDTELIAKQLKELLSTVAAPPTLQS